MHALLFSIGHPTPRHLGNGASNYITGEIWTLTMICRLIFVSMTNLLLISSLVSLMSMSLEGVRSAIVDLPTRSTVGVLISPLGDGSCPGRISIPVSNQTTSDRSSTTPRVTKWCGNRLSIYVLESSNSRRLTYFMPPLVRSHRLRWGYSWTPGPDWPLNWHYRVTDSSHHRTSSPSSVSDLCGSSCRRSAFDACVSFSSGPPTCPSSR